MRQFIYSIKEKSKNPTFKQTLLLLIRSFSLLCIIWGAFFIDYEITLIRFFHQISIGMVLKTIISTVFVVSGMYHHLWQLSYIPLAYIYNFLLCIEKPLLRVYKILLKLSYRHPIRKFLQA